jgi:hypothetical protein
VKLLNLLLFQTVHGFLQGVIQKRQAGECILRVKSSICSERPKYVGKRGNFVSFLPWLHHLWRKRNEEINYNRVFGFGCCR